MRPQFVSNFDIAEVMSAETVRSEVDKLLDEKLQLLTADAVKKLIADVIRRHLGWLVVWGNLFGTLPGGGEEGIVHIMNSVVWSDTP